MGADYLAIVVDLMVLVAVAVFYTGFAVWFNYRKDDLNRANAALRQGGVAIVLLGVLLGVLGMFGELYQPLFNLSYNVFFFDPLTMLAFLLVAFGVLILLRLSTTIVGVLGAASGVAVLYYGVVAYQDGLTLDPVETLLMYIAFGVLACALLIPTLFIDWFITGPKYPNTQPIASDPTPKYPMMWNLLIGIFMLTVFLAGLAAALYGLNIAWGHILP